MYVYVLKSERDKMKFSVYKLYYGVGLTDYIIFTQRTLVYIEIKKEEEKKDGGKMELDEIKSGKSYS